MSVIDNRVNSIANLDYKRIAIDENRVASELKNILSLMQEPVSSQITIVSSIDTSNLNETEVREWMRTLELECDFVNVYWFSFKKGIRIHWEMFLQHYSDLWYPGVDDVAITDDSVSWVLEMSHEEIFSLRRVT